MLDDHVRGTLIESDAQHPIAVFSGHECAQVPADLPACDHLEEQLPGLSQLGTHFVAARVPPRAMPPETSVWEIYATRADTELTFQATADVTGLPQGPQQLAAGKMLELEVGGPQANFELQATQPVLLINYMTGGAVTEGAGDPSMVVLPSTDRFLDNYTVLAPPEESWAFSYVTVTRKSTTVVNLDSAAIPSTLFAPVGAGAYEVAQVKLTPGVHRLTADTPFGATIAGWIAYTSFAHGAGMNTTH
jgi:hypothetical protein